eukprot:IDg15794t1
MKNLIISRGHLLLELVPQQYLNVRARIFIEAVSDPMQQMVVYDRHKRKHMLKFQATNILDRVILPAHRPAEGRLHDWLI